MATIIQAHVDGVTYTLDGVEVEYILSALRRDAHVEQRKLDDNADPYSLEHRLNVGHDMRMLELLRPKRTPAKINVLSPQQLGIPT